MVAITISSYALNDVESLATLAISGLLHIVLFLLSLNTFNPSDSIFSRRSGYERCFLADTTVSECLLLTHGGTDQVVSSQRLKPEFHFQNA